MRDATVWLNRQQLAESFDRDIKTIGKHINNVLKEGYDNSTVVKFETVQKEGNREITREIEYYNLDVIISVGYRAKSKNGILFRKWANKILKEYLIKGYTINQARLEYLEKTVKLIDIDNRIDSKLDNNDAKEIIKVINEYSSALNLLDEYDHKTLVRSKGMSNNITPIVYRDCLNIITKMKFKNASNLFGI